MKDKLNFKVSSELKNILGRDLITDDNIAVLELVKNSYDAYATKVDITFEDNGITVADNGKGMTKEEIIDKWLFVGYSAKRDNTEDTSYRAKFKRHYAGAKGIGRLSCDRLSRYVQLTTKSAKSSTTEIINVDWETFEGNQREEFDDVSIDHESTTQPITFPTDADTGTILKLSGLHRKWSRVDILHLKSSLEKMINPFKEADDFTIELIVPSLKEEDQNIRQELQKVDYELLDENGKKNYSAKKVSIVNGIIKNTISDVLKIKTTQIESYIRNNTIITKLSDRGELMYEIEEDNPFSKLSDASVNIYYLNRAAKYNFSLRMGMQPVNYGNIFLFRNGIRILPYGEPDNDGWGLNQRSQQGYNRFLSTRDLFGRVDVRTDNLDDFKEVSSRDGGLIKNESTNQLFRFFEKAQRRLERYVVGVLWGEGFIKNDYFINDEVAQSTRKALQENDKISSDANTVYKNIGSKIDYLQLIKGLVNDSSVRVINYNEELADIVKNINEKDVIRENIFGDLKKVAEKTNNSALLNQVNQYQHKIEELTKAKEAAEKQAKLERGKREIAEKERDAQEQKNIYLSATRNTTQEVQDITHAISVNSTELVQLLSNLVSAIPGDDEKSRLILSKISEASFYANRIQQMSQLITKADIESLKAKVRVDIIEYLIEYVKNFKRTLDIKVDSNGDKVWKIMSLLDLAIVMDNLISNSSKNEASTILLTFKTNSRQVILDFSDDGSGVDKRVFTNKTLFEEGVTNRHGGSGIGLHTIKYTMENKVNGKIEFVDNGLHGMKGATFRLFFN